MPERKSPIVAIVAAHERRKTVDDILNNSFPREVTEVMLLDRMYSCGFLIVCAHILGQCGLFQFRVNS